MNWSRERGVEGGGIERVGVPAGVFVEGVEEMRVETGAAVDLDEEEEEVVVLGFRFVTLFGSGDLTTCSSSNSWVELMRTCD
jgi:hypothetical protein